MTRTEQRDLMLAHVAAQEQSGKSRKDYCQAHGVKPHVLNYWCARVRKRAMATGFAPVEIATGASMELHYPNGVRLVLPAGTAMAQIVACIRLY